MMTTTTTWRVRWPDGSVVEAATACQLLDDVRAQQWRGYSALGFRRQLARRARVWSGTRVRPWASAAAFLHDLEAAKMLQILEAGDE